MCLAVAACSKDELPGTHGEFASLTLSVASSQNDVKTRAVSADADEQRINNLYIFIFNPDGSVDCRNYISSLSASSWTGTIGGLTCGTGKSVAAIANTDNTVVDITREMLDGIASGSNTLASAAGLAALALIGGLVVLAFTKLYGTVFLGSPRTHEVAESSEADAFRIAAMALPLAGILFVGLFPRAAVSAVTRAAGFFLRTPADAADWLLSPPLAAAGRTAWLLIAVMALLLWLRRRTLRTRTVAKGPTWGCGFTAPNVRMQYTGESFSEGLQSIATSLTQNSGQGSPVGKGEIFPAAHSFDIGHRDRIGRLFAAWWVELLRVINQRVMRLRTGKINHYILFALAFLGLVFLLSVFNVI